MKDMAGDKIEINNKIIIILIVLVLFVVALLISSQIDAIRYKYLITNGNYPAMYKIDRISGDIYLILQNKVIKVETIKTTSKNTSDDPWAVVSIGE